MTGAGDLRVAVLPAFFELTIIGQIGRLIDTDQASLKALCQKIHLAITSTAREHPFVYLEFLPCNFAPGWKRNP